MSGESCGGVLSGALGSKENGVVSRGGDLASELGGGAENVGCGYEFVRWVLKSWEVD